MIHEILPVGPLQCNCSIIGDEASLEAMVIDPGDDIADVLALIQKHNLQVKQIVVTHAHIDHVGGAMKLRAATGAPILLNQNDYTLLKMLDVQAAWIGVPPPGNVDIDHSISDLDKVQAGSLVAQVMQTPGHTEGSICLYFPAQKKLIAGDTLFAGSIGRTDLPVAPSKKSFPQSTRSYLLCQMRPSWCPDTAHSPVLVKSASLIPSCRNPEGQASFRTCR
jgi:glyoxylase-like metal-dependent hydrolase (beta-lactamase superfamily II)